MKNPLLSLLGLILVFFAVRAVLSQPQGDRSPLPPNWTHHDVGIVKIPGNACIADAAYEISGSGGDPFGTADAFHFAHQSWNGDAVLVARVLAFTGGNGTGKAGLMFRSGLEPGAVNVLLAMGGSNCVTLQRRFELNDPSEDRKSTRLNSSH